MTVFEAYITNLGKYAEGQLVGETLKFPATTEEVQSLLENIGVDGVRYEEFFITAFDGDVMGLYDYLTIWHISFPSWTATRSNRWRPYSTRATTLPAWRTSSTSFTIWTATSCTPA